MTVAAKPNNEQERLEVLLGYNILDSAEEEEFNNIVKLASQICKCPFSLISLIDSDRLWFKAKVGFDISETPRDYSFCAHAILTPDKPLLVSDVRRDVRFYDNPLVVGGPKLRFYAGFPLVTKSGFVLGTLCVIDRVSKDLTEEQEFAMKTLAQQVVSQIELRQKVTRLQGANKIIQEQNETLERLNQTKGKLISILSHDVRSALSSLKSVVHLFKEGELELEETQQLMQLTDGHIDSTLELLENLLNWSATQLDTKDLQLQAISLNFLVNEAFKLNETKASLKANKLENLIPEELQIKGDRDIIRFVLRNLIANANKFTINGSIRVKLDENSEYYNISIIDSGVGLTQEQIDKLFHTQFRNTTLGTNGEHGSGIGIQLCKELIARHKGKITVRSTKNEGASFIFSIPKKIGDESERLNNHQNISSKEHSLDYSNQHFKTGVA